jgi:hypothetical protein
MQLAREIAKLLLTVGVFAVVMPILLAARWMLVGLAWVMGARR